MKNRRGVGVVLTVEGRLREGCVVLCDRYDLSSLVYQGVLATPPGESPSARLHRVRALNSRARRPDVTVVYAVSPAEARKRQAARGGRAAVFDADEKQVRVAHAYELRVSDLVPGDCVEYVNGGLLVKAVTEETVKVLEPYLPPLPWMAMTDGEVQTLARGVLALEHPLLAKEVAALLRATRGDLPPHDDNGAVFDLLRQARGNAR